MPFGCVPLGIATAGGTFLRTTPSASLLSFAHVPPAAAMPALLAVVRGSSGERKLCAVESG